MRTLRTLVPLPGMSFTPIAVNRTVWITAIFVTVTARLVVAQALCHAWLVGYSHALSEAWFDGHSSYTAVTMMTAAS